MTTRIRLLAAVLLTVSLAGCQHAVAQNSPTLRPEIQLSAKLTSPTDIDLQWQGTDPAAAGLVVEFATDRHGPYADLQFVPPGQTTYRHPDLMPDTTFCYRVMPFYGPASGAVDVTLPPGDFDENAHRDNPDWAAPRTRPDPGAAKQSILQPGTATAGTPTDLHATIMDPNGITFTWTDHASDEDGYLIEVKPAGSLTFGVVAVLAADVNSYGLVTLPSEKRASYRVRAFYYGAPSNVAQQTTGQSASG
jgi:hypothetical protein